MYFTATAVRRTIPAVLARFFCLVRFLTGTAVPTPGLTGLSDTMPLLAFFAKPFRFARLIGTVRLVTACAKPNFLCVKTVRLLAIQSAVRVLRSARRATPGVLSKRIFGGMNRFTRFARPAPVFTGYQRLFAVFPPPTLLRSMNGFTCLAPPGRLPNAEIVPLPIHFGFIRANRLFVFHVAFRTKPFGMHIRNGKTSDNNRCRKQL